MEIFKLFESTLVNVQPGHISTKDLRRDQLLARYDEATKTLETLIKAKENELKYRKDLVEMLEKSKTIYDNKLTLAKQAYLLAKKHAPESLDLKVPHEAGIGKKLDVVPVTSASQSTASFSTTPTTTPPKLASTNNNDPIPGISSSFSSTTTSQQQQPFQPSLKDSDLDIPLTNINMENRTSLDRRLSEFLKTFPNLTQAGLAQQANNNEAKPSPGYYTQQPPPPLPPPQMATTAPPMMAMLRFPPPPLVPPPQPHHHLNLMSQENHDGPADMDLSDYDEPMNNGGTSSSSTPNVPVLPMIASAMQQGAGGNKQLRAEVQATYLAGPHHHQQQQQQHYSSPSTVQYGQPRLNSLPFDPSIMDSRLRDSPSSSGGSGTRDRHLSSHSGERGASGSHRHSGSGSSSGSVKHGSDKNKYPSSAHSSSSRSSKRR